MSIIFKIITLLALSRVGLGDTYGGLYPRESESREVKNLDGIWDFRLAPRDDPNLGFNEEWYAKPLRLVSISA